MPHRVLSLVSDVFDLAITAITSLITNDSPGTQESASEAPTEQEVHAETLVVGEENSWCGNCSIVAKFCHNGFRSCVKCGVVWKYYALNCVIDPIKRLALQLCRRPWVAHLLHVGTSKGLSSARDGEHHTYFVDTLWREAS